MNTSPNQPKSFAETEGLLRQNASSPIPPLSRRWWLVATTAGAFLAGPALWAQPGNCLQYDGVNDFVNIGHRSSLDLGNTLTFEAWIKPSALTNRHGVFSTR